MARKRRTNSPKRLRELAFPEVRADVRPDNAFRAARARALAASEVRQVVLAGRADSRPRLTPEPVKALDAAPPSAGRRLQRDAAPASSPRSLPDNCKARPTNGRGGDGSSRSFVPWCKR